MGRSVYYRPTEGLHRRFAGLAPTREAALAFVREYGVLGEWFGGPDAADQDYEAFSKAQFDVWDVLQANDKGGARRSDTQCAGAAPHERDDRHHESAPANS